MSGLQRSKNAVSLPKYSYQWINGNNGNIFYSGNVGINTRSDSQYNLDVSGTSNISGNIIIRGNLTTINDVSFNGNLFVRGSLSGTSLSAGTTGTITGGAILIKNGTNTFIDISNSSIIIPTINSYQFFNRQMTTNESSFTSLSAYFASGVKIINLSYSHASAGTSSSIMTLTLKNATTTTTLQSCVSPRYVSTIQAGSRIFCNFHFKTNNIASQNITMTISIAVTGSTYYSDGNDYINCVMYNLPNNV